MKAGSKINTALCLFLLLAVLTGVSSLLPGTARAEELVELLEPTGELLLTEEAFEDAVELIDASDVLLEELSDVPADHLSGRAETDAAELIEDIADEAQPADAGAGLSSEGGDGMEQAVFFAAPEGADEHFDIGFYAVVDGDLDLWLYVALPDSADPAVYRIDASGRSFAFAGKDASGRYVFPVLTGVRPHEIANKVDVSLLRGETPLWKFSVSPIAYLWQLVIGTASSAPSRRAVYVGAVSGVSDYRAKLVQSSGDTAVKIYFRADDVSGLSFSCDGHTVSAPVAENAGIWSVLISGVHVNELPADFVVTGSRADQTVTLRFSPFSYAAMHWGETDRPFIVLCRALASAF